MAFLLDTCAVLWLAGEPERLSETVRQSLTVPSQQVSVSAITVGELACLVDKERLSLPCHWRRWFRQAIHSNGWSVFPVDLDTIEEAYSLPDVFHTDPADRILVATARIHRFTLVTGDKKILDYPHVQSVC